MAALCRSSAWAAIPIALASCTIDQTSIGFEAPKVDLGGSDPPPGRVDMASSDHGPPRLVVPLGPNDAPDSGLAPSPPPPADPCEHPIVRRALDIQSWYRAGADPQRYRVDTADGVGTVSSTIAGPSESVAFGASVMDIDADLGHEVRFSTIVWGEGISGSAELFMGVGAADGHYLAFATSLRPFTADPSENRRQIVLPIGPAAHWISFGIALTGRGVVSALDPMLEIVDPAARDYLPDPGGWFLAGTAPQEYAVGPDSAVVHCGRSASRIASVARKPTGFATLLQEVSADDYRGARVRMTGAVRVENVANIAALWLRGDDDKGNPLAFDNMDDRPIQGTHDFTSYAIVLDIPNDVESLFFGMYLDGTGVAWVDGVKFEIVDERVPTTR